MSKQQEVIANDGLFRFAAFESGRKLRYFPDEQISRTVSRSEEAENAEKALPAP